MSELKAFDIVVAEEGNGEGIVKYRRAVYDKAEVDKVIAELKEENEKLKATPEQIMKEVFDKCLIYPKEMVRLDDAYKLAVSLRKQKYKRCLAMAKIESHNWHLHNSFYLMGHKDFELKKCERYERHRMRWLEIAEKFKDKEAK